MQSKAMQSKVSGSIREEMEHPREHVRVGIIGTGGIANDYLLPALKRVPEAIFWSVLSRDKGRATAFATTHGAHSPDSSHCEVGSFLNDPRLDAVIIASPDKLHAEQAICAARASKHVFVEKPLATNLNDAESVVDACRSMKVQLGVGYHLRWHSGHRLLAHRIAQGELGTITHARIQWTLKSSADDWRRDDSLGKWWALAAVGTHQIDLLNWLLKPVCGEITAITSLCTPAPGGGNGDATALVSLRFQSGATGEILSSVLFKAPRLIEIYGSKASAVCKDTLGPRGAGEITLNGNQLEFTVNDPYELELANFVQAILTGTAPESSGENGKLNVALLEKATA